MQEFLPDQHSALNTPSVDVLCHTRHATQLVISSSPIFDQPRTYRLPATDSALPIWGLDVSLCADANVSDWSDASALTYSQQGSVMTLRSLQRHDSNRELPLLPLLPLPLPFTVLDTQLAARLVTPTAAAASAGAATAAASVHVDTGTSDDSKPKKKKVKRARILKEGSLTLIPYGMDERLTWVERIGHFTRQARSVLGDRSFSKPWGGSVLDSVIGTFLTQNVSDQLSSKAYMTLAATFPPKLGPVTPSTAAFPPKLDPVTLSTATFPPKLNLTTPSTATSPPKPTSATPCRVLANQATVATTEQANDMAPLSLAARQTPVRLKGSCPTATSEGGISAGGAGGPVGAQPTLSSVETGEESFEVLDICTVEDVGSRKVVRSGVGAGPQGGIVPSDGAAECSDSVDWEAVRLAPPSKVAEAIQCRGMHNRLADSIQAFLNRLHASALAAQQAQHGAAAPSQGPACSPPRSQELALSSIPPADPKAPVSTPHKPHFADISSPQLSQSTADLQTPGKHLGVPQRVGCQACPAQGPHGAAAAAALLFRDASTLRDVIPQMGASPVASQAHSLPAAAADTAGDAAATAAAAGDGTAAAAAGDAAAAVAGAAAAGDTAAASDTAATAAAAAAGDTPPVAAVLGSSTWPDGDGEPGSGGVEAGSAAPEAQLSLEWLRSAPPDVATAFLMSVEGQAGVAPKVDKYAPETEVHKYLHSRLASFDTASLYELHYQMITLGKVFCSKVSPNCTACPLQTGCEYALSHGRKYQSQPAAPSTAKQQVKNQCIPQQRP
ncbi:hypothetical protein ABBQ38_009343 [Trebouxia sp. C0009 RCD-2024]